MCSFEGTEEYIKKKKRTDDVLFFCLPGKFVEIVLVSKKRSVMIVLRRSRKCCYSNPPQAENVASDILYSVEIY